MNVLYMACNVDTRTGKMCMVGYKLYWNKEDAEKHAEFLERCNQLYRDEYDPGFDIFDIGQDTREARVYSVPYFGTGHPENEATLVRSYAEEDGEPHPLVKIRIVFDDAWEGKMTYWEFFGPLVSNALSYSKGPVVINESFDAQRYESIFQHEVRLLKNAQEYRG